MVKLDANMTHEEVQQVLPWYANKRLDADVARRVEAHLADCAICRGDIEGLATVFAVHEQSLDERPVDEARLDALFARIDRHETERRRMLQRREQVGFIARLVHFLTRRPALAGGSLAAVLLAVFLVPVLFQAQAPSKQEFAVLSTKGAEAAPFVLRVRFKAPVERTEVERIVAASASELDLPQHRIEQMSPTDFAVVFVVKPSVAAAGTMLVRLAGSADIAAASIDDGSSSDAARNGGAARN